jgi:hypothetical protein
MFWAHRSNACVSFIAMVCQEYVSWDYDPYSVLYLYSRIAHERVRSTSGMKIY